jgi:phage tail tape-measure protein
MAALEVSKAEDDVAYKNLKDSAKFGLVGATAAGVGAGLGATATGAGVGAGIGAIVGSIVPVIGTAVGAAVGAGIGAIGGAIGGYFAGETAKDAALEDTQKTTEQLAKAIASGAIVDDGRGYQVKDRAKLAELGIKEEELDNFYAEVGESTAELREFGNQLLETEK